MQLVSVVVPSHNRPEMLAQALASVRDQTFTDYEVIVVSNGESAEMRNASRAMAFAHDARYFVLDKGNLPAARNFGVGQASGEWIAFLDDDDIWLPNKLDRQLAAARVCGADMIACDYVEFYPDGGEVIQQPRLPRGWSYTEAFNHGNHWWAPPSCVLLRKAAVDSVGGFDRRQRFGEDNDLWRRVSWRHTIHQMEEVLTRYRRGHTSLTGNRRRVVVYELRHMVKMYLDTPRDLRSTLPSLYVLAWRLAEATLPKFVHQPFNPTRLKRRSRALRSAMQTLAPWLVAKSESADTKK